MAVPKKKISSSRRGKRRSHHALIDSMVMECPNCGAEKDDRSPPKEPIGVLNALTMNESLFMILALLFLAH